MSAPPEVAVTFECAGEQLVGILHPASPAADTGVVIIVGGPQYRVGSHRQFVLLARALAGAGHPVLRFDCRGMGDSAGEPRGFEQIAADIGAAIDALQHRLPSVHRVVLWGLCDGASAALLYCDETHDQRITGLCLANPWVRSEESLARTQVKHYYVQRLAQPEFWSKLVRGKVGLGAGAELVHKLRLAGRSHAPEGNSIPRAAPDPFQSRMARAFQQMSGRTLLLLSENDYTAKEFLEYTRAGAAWRACVLSTQTIAGADHTFSDGCSRATAEQATVDWMQKRIELPVLSL